MEHTSRQAVIQKLKDAGCSRELAEQFLVLEEKGKRKEQLALLSWHRSCLQDQVRREEQRIDCLDYLAYQLEKAVQAK